MIYNGVRNLKLSYCREELVPIIPQKKTVRSYLMIRLFGAF